MATRTFNFINTTAGLKVNYPSDMPVSEVPRKPIMFIRLNEDGKTYYETDDNKFLLSNGPLFVYVTKEELSSLEFQAGTDKEPFTVLQTQLLRSASANAKPITLSF